MIRAVADTNVYISAFNFGGMPLRILRLAQDGAFILCLSPPILEETREVLRLRFGWSEAETRRALDPILEVARVTEPNVRVAVAEDPDDNRILECAQEAGAQFIVTGDHHLLRLKRFQGAEIVTPRAFLERRVWR
ncbi:MAG: putative toxin-antitoxin system toxin component, PIN family [Acidobacteria bacterium]|nr:putative toxin-antitoxin system toxin component, PIN family [Acidobacteriota bacterium]